jgi:hypothetical protein
MGTPTLYVLSAFAVGLVLVATRPGLAESELQSGLPLTTNAVIEVKSFDAGTETFCVFAVKFPGEGDSFVTPKALAEAVKPEERPDILGKPGAIVGKQFETTSELKTVEGEALDLAHPACTPG